MRKAFAAVVMVIALINPAHAQSGRVFAGTWAVQTEVNPGWGIVSGAMVIRGSGPTYQIDFMAHSISPGDDAPIRAFQRCNGLANGARLTITCTLIDSDSPTYAADHFDVAMIGDRMTGLLLSESGNEDVRFSRIP